MRNGKASKGRQVIVIEPIQDKDRCQVTFSKRKSGIFKKASEIILRCDARVAVVIFSKAGKPYALGSPSVDDVLRLVDVHEDGAPAQQLSSDVVCERGVPAQQVTAVADRAAAEAMVRQHEDTKALVAAEQLRVRTVGDRVMQAAAGRRFWWEADVEKLGAAELPEFTRALQQLRDNLHRHIERV